MRHSIFFKGIEFDFDMDYQPHERQTFDHPEVHEEYEIYNIEIKGWCAETLIADQIEEFEEAVKTEHRENNFRN